MVSVEEIATKWEVSVRCVQEYCRNGRIPDAIKTSGVWMIPENAVKPMRISGGKRKRSKQSSSIYCRFFPVAVEWTWDLRGDLTY